MGTEEQGVVSRIEVPGARIEEEQGRIKAK
jgi:hypothetical protein